MVFRNINGMAAKPHSLRINGIVEKHVNALEVSNHWRCKPFSCKVGKLEGCYSGNTLCKAVQVFIRNFVHFFKFISLVICACCAPFVFGHSADGAHCNP